MQTVQAALAAMAPHFAPLPAEQVPLSAAFGRVVACDIAASHDTPGFDNSAMDGYAVRYTDDIGPGSRLPVRGEAAAGQAPCVLAEGTAMRIFTGAAMPAGADTVIIQENVRRLEAGAIEVLSAPRQAGQHVRPRAGDVARGQPLLPRGSVLRAGEIALLASQGCASIAVHRRPTVAILSTGDELYDPGQPLPAGALYNSNGPALAALTTEAGGVPRLLPSAPDDVAQIEARIRQALDADLIITSGGVSVGDHDNVAEALSRAGVQKVLWKVAIKPGKPIWFGVPSAPKAARPAVFGLPGNPVSAMLTFEVFVRPALRRLLGQPRPHRRSHLVTLAHDHRRSAGRDELARARLLDRGDDGLWRVALHRQQGSGSLRSMCDVDALLWLPAADAAFSAGDRVEALLLSPAAYQGGPNAPGDGADGPGHPHGQTGAPGTG